MAALQIAVVRRLIPLLLGFAVALAGAAQAAGRGQASRDVIIVAGDHNYPPYEFINADGQPDGYNTDLTRAIAEVMGMDVEIQLGGWAEMRQRLDNGEVDALQGVSYSADRAKIYAFSPPHAIVHHSVFARKGDAQITDLTQLRGKEVIVQEQGILHDLMLHDDVGAKLILADTHADALRLLASGKHDYALVANLPGLYLGRELELSNIVPVGKTFAAQRYGYAVLKGHAELLAQFSEGLAILKNTGRQQAIYDKWFGPLQSSGVPWKKIGQVAGLVSIVLLLVLGAIVIWNRMLTREVTRRTQELQIQQQKLIQADKMTSLGVLVSGVAHEINNPCGLLLLNLPVLEEVYRDSADILEAHYHEHGDFDLGGLSYARMRDEVPLMLDDMLAGAQRIRRIVDDLRDFARQGPVELSESVDLNAVVATAIRLVDNTIRNATDHFRVSYAATAPAFRGHGQKIEQVVINLIVNACQALESRDNAITVTTRYDSADGMLRLEVLDEGRGIEPENLSQLSDPFFTTKREQGGMGLGLSVSVSIVKEHAGMLEYYSSPARAPARCCHCLPTRGPNQHEQ
ncbi:transporter substrate-binding domain-containing protein [Marinobacterium sedimentorum]|uniref:transporter substrate-binding domain-containing protein n=1 Tax=Marinobacterium sedimentorum TaxID=2927804 RepID=UPI0020C634BC|nr:transporter substrate-binding domain-containing protein [Marinobacterium sedimentorum]MCP8686626.1 transporter substrate-binding domain-containing protein [Marinobacterium sedimentorum]